MWSILVKHGKLSFSLQSQDVQIPIIVCLTHKCIQLDINGHEISYKLFASQSQNVSKGTYTHTYNATKKHGSLVKFEYRLRHDGSICRQDGSSGE